MARDINSAKQNTKLTQLEKLADQQDDECLVLVMNSEDGRRVVCKLARQFGWMGDIWDGSNARATDYNAGKQSAARELMAWAERVAPAQFLTAIGEATRRDVEQAELAKAVTTDKNEEQDDG